MKEIRQNPPITFSAQELHTLQKLRTRYAQDSDRFSQREWARIEFLRWLYQEGCPDPRAGNDDRPSDDVACPVENRSEEDGDVT
jgi:hypothetical protein